MTYSIKQKVSEDSDLNDKEDYILHLMYLASNDKLQAKAEFESLNATAQKQVLGYAADNDYTVYNYFMGL